MVADGYGHESGALVSVRDRWGVMWLLVVLLYGVGDTVTTFIGLRTSDVSETGPVALYAIEVAGSAGFLGIKAGFIGSCFLAWWMLDSPSRIAIPAALIAAGAVITVWNVVMIVL